jgi:predicted acyl esterase
MTNWRTGVESAAEYGVLKAVEVMMPVRDGVRLATDLYFPAEPERLDRRVEGRFPVILVRTPSRRPSTCSPVAG